jgi:hypothetical protein
MRAKSSGDRARGHSGLELKFTGTHMALRTGELYRCPNENCGCEIQVTRGAKPGGGGDNNPRCCCGMEMKKVD